MRQPPFLILPRLSGKTSAVFVAALFAQWPSPGDVRQLLRQGQRMEALRPWSRTAPQRQIIARMFLSQDTFQLFQDGIHLMEQRLWSQAESKFRAALDREPDHFEILLRLAQTLLSQKGSVRNLAASADESKELLKKALVLCPQDMQARLWLGRAYLDKGEWDQALVALRIVYVEAPQWEWTAAWIAEAMQAKKQMFAEFLLKHLQTHPIHLPSMVALVQQRGIGEIDGPDYRRVSRWILSRWDEYLEIKSDRKRALYFEGELGFDYESPKELEKKWRLSLALKSE